MKLPYRFQSYLQIAVVPLLALGGIGAAGCSPDSKVLRQRIEGQVLLDGAPLDHGSVRFEPEGAKIGISAGAVIEKGRFAIDAERGLPTGKYKVAISSTEGGTTEPKMPDPNSPPPRERIPAKYNTQTELAIDVNGEIINEIVFELTSK